MQSANPPRHGQVRSPALAPNIASLAAFSRGVRIPIPEVRYQFTRIFCSEADPALGRWQNP